MNILYTLHELYKHIRCISITVVLFLLFSCTQKINQPYDLESAYILSGKNRPEIERVIEYYRDEGGLKYDAACFLIANMRYHKSRERLDGLDKYVSHFRHTDMIYDSFQGKKIPDSIKRQHSTDFNTLPSGISVHNNLSDLYYLSSDFLIHHINNAFYLWENIPELKALSFDEFKEFVLPYRTTNESSDEKARIGYDLIKARILSPNDTTANQSIGRLKNYVYRVRDLNKYTQPKTHLGIWDLFIKKFDYDCHNMTSWCCNLFRQCGIPAVYEFTPQWKNQAKRHFWTVTYDHDGILKPFTAPDNTILEDYDTYIKYAGKVYRRTYEAQYETPYFISNGEENIPTQLSSPLLLDQTFRYHNTVKISLPFDCQTENNICYLAMLDNDKLNPVAWGKIDKHKGIATFNHVPVNTVFIPVYYFDEQLLTFSSPFMLHTSTKFKPFTSNHQISFDEVIIKDCRIYRHKNKSGHLRDLQYISISPSDEILDMRLLRKYPDKPRLRKFREQLLGAVLLGSDEEKKNFDTLMTVTTIPEPYLQEIAFEIPKPYLFYRFITRDSLPVNIAHMEFIGPPQEGVIMKPATKLPVFSPIEDYETENVLSLIGTPLRTGSDPVKAFDGDFNTFVGSSSIAMRYEIPVAVNRIRFIPRNAGNGITPGQRYSLLFYDAGWKEHSQVTAFYNYLDFENVPAGTIYWLKNLSEGNEEHPFFYVDGKQFFINIDIEQLPISLWKRN